MKKNKLDRIFLIGITVVAISGMIADAIYWRGVSEGGFPVFSCTIIFVSYALLIGLLIYNSSKGNQEKLQYVKWPMLIGLPFLHLFIIVIIMLIVALIINVFNLA